MQQKAHAYLMGRFENLGKELSETGLTLAIVQAIQGELPEWVKKHITGQEKEKAK